MPIATDDLPHVGENDLIQSVCRESFRDFVRQFWDTVVPAAMSWNWHMDYLCGEMQTLAERVFRDRGQ